MLKLTIEELQRLRKGLPVIRKVDPDSIEQQLRKAGAYNVPGERRKPQRWAMDIWMDGD